MAESPVQLVLACVHKVMLLMLFRLLPCGGALVREAFLTTMVAANPLALDRGVRIDTIRLLRCREKWT